MVTHTQRCTHERGRGCLRLQLRVPGREVPPELLDGRLEVGPHAAQRREGRLLRRDRLPQRRRRRPLRL